MDRIDGGRDIYHNEDIIAISIAEHAYSRRDTRRAAATDC